MRIRRCAVVYLEPREDIAFDLGSLLGGGDGLARTRRWIALAPHLGEEVDVDADERELLGVLGPGQWVDPVDLGHAWAGAVASLLAKGLLVADIAGAGAAVDADLGSIADAVAGADACADSSARAHAEAEAEFAAANRNANAYANANGNNNGNANADADADADADAKAKVDSRADAGADAGGGVEAGCAAADRNATANANANAEAKVDSRADAGADVGGGAGAGRGSANEVCAASLDPSALTALRERDDRLRGTYWHPLAATLHAFTRWRDVDTVRNSIDSGTETAVSMREVLGPPPVEAAVRADAATHLPLPRSAPTEFDRLLARRVTCRNFDPTRPLPQALFAQVLERVFAAKAQVRVTGDTVFLKKSVPSGGGLHPMECYLIVQHVDGVPRGLYHYQAAQHALEPLPSPDGVAWTAESLRGFVMEVVAQQHWFQDAHVLVLLAPRFDRTFWKYRHHAKGYRVIALEGGHLSQTLYLAATDAGLGAFITGAINEHTLERAFGLDPVDQGALAICGFGWRAAEMVTAELDPNGEIWTTATDAAAD